MSRRHELAAVRVHGLGDSRERARVLCNSLMNNDGMLAADKTIKLNPATSLLHYDVGDEIRLSESDFLLLSEAFLAEVESKYL